MFVTAILIVLIWNSYFKKDLSIIVLPFDNFSNNPNNVYIADGIREDILNNLYRITDLRVISRTSAEQFRDSKFSARQIAKKLKVRYVLEGSIRDNGESFKISVQLIDASSIHEEHVWGDSFYRKLNDLSGVQDEISLQVVSNIKSSLSEGEIKQFSKTRTENSAAYNYYLQARFLHHQGSGLNRHGFDAEGVKNCVKYYELALNEDPKFAEAYSGMAKAWFNLSAWGILGSAEGFIKARELSLKAIEIDPECAEAHCVLAAFYVWGQRNFDEGEKEFLTSIQLNPNYATSRQWYAQFLMIKGPIEESREQINIALELEPYFWVIQNLNSWIYYFEKKYNKSLEACTKAYDYNSNFSSNYWLFVLNYAKLGEGEKMKKQLQLITKNYSKSEMFNEAIQQAYDKQGINGLFLWMIDTNKNNPIPVEGLNGHPYYSAWWYALLKDKKETIFWLEKTLEEKYIPYHYFNLIATNPDFSFLSGEPGFHSVIEKAGLSKFYR